MVETCGDNRFEIIEAAKRRLIEATNIDDRLDEMAVIDSVLFRIWQMGWLPGCERANRTCNMTWHYSDNGGSAYTCSNCGRDTYPFHKSFEHCPHCTAKVVGD